MKKNSQFSILNSQLVKGQTLIELILVFALSAIVLPALFVGLFTSREGAASQKQRLAAIALLKEGEEATRVVRETGWNTFAVNGTYHPTQAGGNWALVAGSESVNGFTRTIQIADVYRDSAGAVVTSGGTVDPSTKKVTTTVSWTTPLPSSVSSNLYLVRLDNLTWVTTTQADFNAGTHVNTTVTNTAGGEVALGAGGAGAWCNPLPNVVATRDLPKNGVANAVSAYEGRVVAGTGENASGISFADLSISNTNPPVVTQTATFDGYKTNDVFLSGDYGYIATDTNAKEIVIVQMTGGTITEVGSFDAPGSSDGTSMYVSGNRGYMTQGTTLNVIDLSSKTGARPQVGPSLALGGTGNKIVVVGDYAYIAIGSSVIKLQIVDISDPTDPSKFRVVGQLSLAVEPAVDVYVNASGTRAYLATGVSSTLNEFFIVDTSIKNLSLPTVGSYNASGMDPRAVTVVTGNRAILAGHGAEEYQVIDISTEALPIRCGGMDVNTGVNDVISVLEADGDAFSYIVTQDATTEFKVIEGGPGGNFATSGTYTSQIFDAGVSTAFNRIEFTLTKPPNTDLTLQVAAADAVSGSCTGAVYAFVGPDGTPATSFSAVGPIAIDDDGSGYENPARCFRYTADFSTSDPNASPILSDVTVNYSP